MATNKPIKRNTRAFADAMAKDPNMGANPAYRRKQATKKQSKKK